MGNLSSLREMRYYRILIWIGILLCGVILFWRGSHIVTSYKWLRIDDFVEYWAAGQLNLNGGNPFDPTQLLPLQHMAGRYFGVPVMMWNPPWMLALAMPFSLFSYPISRTLWILAFIVIVFVSASITWKIYGGSNENRWMSWIIGFTFVPVLQAIRTGQTGPLLLLGVVGFLYFMRQNKPWRAGMLVSLITIKPHILYLFGLAIIVWCLYRRQWAVILGSALTLAIATLAVYLINPNVLNQYIYAATHYPPEDWATPTLGGISRLLLGIEYFWMQFIPPVLGIIWFVIYWVRHRKTWDWIEQAPLIILISILTAAYGWTSDQSVSLIAILQIFVLLIPIKMTSTHIRVILSYIIIDILLVVPLGNQIWFWWLAPALLIWYLVSKRLINKQEFLAHQSIIP